MMSNCDVVVDRDRIAFVGFCGISESFRRSVPMTQKWTVQPSPGPAGVLGSTDKVCLFSDRRTAGRDMLLNRC